MEIRKMTEASMLSAAFVAMSIAAIGMGLGYMGYIDFVVPVFTALIYMRCKFRYTVLAAVTSLTIIGMVMGNIVACITMSQSMIIGIICGILIKRNSSILDDLFFAAIGAAFVMIFIDINFATITGYSLIQESSETLEYVMTLVPSNLQLTQGQKDFVYYATISVLPLGATLLAYILSLLAGKRFKFLDSQGLKKFYIIRNFKKCGAYVSCSKNILLGGTIYVIISMIMEKTGYLENHLYLMVILKCTQYVVLFFLIQDSMSYVSKIVYAVGKSRILLLIFQFCMLSFLSNKFNVAFCFLIISNFIIEYRFNIRNKQKILLNAILK